MNKPGELRLALKHDYVTLECQERFFFNGEKCGYRHRVKLTCGNRCCEECAKNDAVKKLYREYRQLLRQGPPGRLLHVVLALEDSKDLEVAIDQILDSLQRLRRWKLYKNWTSGFRVLTSPRHIEPEVDIVTDEIGNPDGVNVAHIDYGWSVRLHLIIEADDIDEVQLGQDWIKATNSLSATVQVTQFKRWKQVDQTLQDILAHIRRGPDLPDEHIEEFNLAMYGKRVFQSFGGWHNVVKLTSDRPSRFLCPLCRGSNWQFIWEDEALESYGSNDASAYPS